MKTERKKSAHGRIPGTDIGNKAGAAYLWHLFKWPTDGVELIEERLSAEIRGNSSWNLFGVLKFTPVNVGERSEDTNGGHVCLRGRRLCPGKKQEVAATFYFCSCGRSIDSHLLLRVQFKTSAICR